MKIDLTHPGTPAVLSFFVPGVGQIFNGKFLWAIFWMIITPGIWIGTQGTLGWILHFLAAWQAFRQAEEKLALKSSDLSLREG
jgi:TM2 domain-containing membrane protein YozV